MPHLPLARSPLFPNKPEIPTELRDQRPRLRPPDAQLNRELEP